MEILFILTLTLGLGALAIFTALHEKPLPVSSMPSGVAPPRPVLIATEPQESQLDEPALPRKAQSIADANFSQTDVLLADALTEMIALKAEIYHLRGRVESLNAQVARLSGEPPSPRPPTSLRRPSKEAA